MKKISYLILLFLFVNLIATGLFTYFIEGRLSDAPTPEKLDAIVILFADFTTDYTALGEESIKRLNHGAEMSKQYNSVPLLCIGGSRPDYRVKGAELMQQYLVGHGVDAELVFANGNSYDTRTNWRDATDLIKEKHWHSVGVVSSAMHLYRFKNFIIGDNQEISLFLLPHPIFQTNPHTSIFELWESVNYEWAAYAAYLLPDMLYEKLLTLIRPQ